MNLFVIGTVSCVAVFFISVLIQLSPKIRRFLGTELLSATVAMIVLDLGVIMAMLSYYLTSRIDFGSSCWGNIISWLISLLIYASTNLLVSLTEYGKTMPRPEKEFCHTLSLFIVCIFGIAGYIIHKDQEFLSISTLAISAWLAFIISPFEIFCASAITLHEWLNEVCGNIRTHFDNMICAFKGAGRSILISGFIAMAVFAGCAVCKTGIEMQLYAGFVGGLTGFILFVLCVYIKEFQGTQYYQQR